MGVHKCHATCLWVLLVAVLLVAVPRYGDLELRTQAAVVEDLPLPPTFIHGAFQRNETLSAALTAHGFAPEVAYALARAIEPVFNVRSFRPGQPFRIVQDPDGALRAFEYTVDGERTLKVDRQDGVFAARLDELPLETHVETITARVDNSLWAALAGFPRNDGLVMELVNIFESQVDFYRDIRAGDQIRLLIEARSHRGEFVKWGSVQAAEFVNAGRPLQAYRFEDEYYDENGMSVRRSLLPSPVQFTRISSGYTTARLHPIYNTVRPHLGIDYAAPTGTPVWAVADGTVSFAGTSGGFGRMVTLRHANGMTTSYAHLSAIHVRVGQRVRQRDVIGLVGMTGTATGPHLDYRMTLNGRNVNPRSVRADPPKPIDPSREAEFFQFIAPLRAGLDDLPAPADAARAVAE